MNNRYSPTWYELFMEPISLHQSEAEVAWVARQLPLPPFHRVLDLCCGTGRHTRLLAARGYDVTGVDWNPQALAQARAADPQGCYLEADMRQLGPLAGEWDAVLCLWQSFGHFSEAENQAVLRQMAQTLRPGGRLILDIYHRGFFAQHQGVRSFERGGVSVVETKRMQGSRLMVHLAYPGTEGHDQFEWHLYTPDEIVEMASTMALRCLIRCTEFDERLAPSTNQPRMQLVWERQAVSP